jgi:dihydrolipoamide dehydrogenase
MTTEETQYDVVIIGGGPGGYAAALYGAAAGLSIAIVERDKVGGTCLHRGCIPAKDFLETAAVHRTVMGAAEFGISTTEPLIDFKVSQVRKNTVVDQLFRGLSGLLRSRKVTILNGTGRLEPGHRVVVVDGPDAGTEITGRHVILAAGSVPRILPGFELSGTLVMTSDEFLDLEKLPESVAVVGGGVIGCEFASLLIDLGVKVTIIEALPSILATCEPEISAVVARSFKKRGVEIFTGVAVRGHTPNGRGDRTVVRFGEDQEVEVESIVVSVGRRARTEGLLGADTGVVLDQGGFVVADEYLQTHADGVWAVGDVVAGTPQLAHVAFAEAIVIIKCILGETTLPVDYAKVPWAIYSHPEVAYCGLTEEQATAQGFAVVTKKDPFGGNSRARIIGDTEGLVKIVAERLEDGSAGRVLGVHLAGPWVTEQLGSGYLAVNWEATPEEVAHFLQPHPSLSENFGETMQALTGRGLHVG